jgi:hypothetical protein
VTQVLLQDVTFLRLLALRDPDPYYYGKTMALMLQANEDRATYRRVGIVELSDSVDLLEEIGGRVESLLSFDQARADRLIMSLGNSDDILKV